MVYCVVMLIPVYICRLRLPASVRDVQHRMSAILQEVDTVAVIPSLRNQLRFVSLRCAPVNLTVGHFAPETGVGAVSVLVRWRQSDRETKVTAKLEWELRYLLVIAIAALLALAWPLAVTQTNLREYFRTAPALRSPLQLELSIAITCLLFAFSFVLVRHGWRTSRAVWRPVSAALHRIQMGM